MATKPVLFYWEIMFAWANEDPCPLPLSPGHGQQAGFLPIPFLLDFSNKFHLFLESQTCGPDPTKMSCD